MSGLIPKLFVADLLQRIDLVELIDTYIPLKKQGNDYVACCPFHQEKTPSFNVISRKQFYYCFGCGSSGNAISFIMNHLQQGFTEAVETLANRLGISVPRDEKTAKKSAVTPHLSDLLSEVSRFYQQQLRQNPEAIAYLRQRGVSGEIAKQFQLGYAPSQWHALETHFRKDIDKLVQTGMLINREGKKYDRYRHRIMFPIHDRHGRIIGFGGRSIDPNDKPKYLNSPETVLFQKNKELYGLHPIINKRETIDAILIVEGYMDVIALAQHGIDYAVAALGTATNTFHMQLLMKYTQRLIFCFDGDEAGKKAAWRALENCLSLLGNAIDIRFIFLPEDQDPDSFIRTEGKEKFLVAVKEALPLNRYLLDSLSAQVNLQNPAGKSQLINLAKPFFSKIPFGSYRELLLQELAQMTRIENHRLNKMIASKNEEPTPSKSMQLIQRTPTRVVLALLLQHPEIYQDAAVCAACQSLSFDKTALNSGQEILKKLLQQVSLLPSINTAGLIELWRDSEHFEIINKLAFWPHKVPQEELKKEFIDILSFLKKQPQLNEVDQLLEKSRRNGLNENERYRLQALLKQRHLTK